MTSVTDPYSSSRSITNTMTLKIFNKKGRNLPVSLMEFCFDSVCDLVAAFTASKAEFSLLGAVLSITQYEIISSAGRPFVFLANRGPLRPLADSPRRRLREVRIKCFKVQQLDIRHLKKLMLSKIHPHYISLMSEPVIRMAQRTIPWIVQDFLLSVTVV